MRHGILTVLLAFMVFPWWGGQQSWPEWCSIDGKGDYIAWNWAAAHADRALMYAVCEDGPYGRGAR